LNDSANDTTLCQCDADAGEVTSEHRVAAILLGIVLLAGGIVFWLLNHPLAEAAQLSDVIGGVGTLVLSLLGATAGLWWFFRRQPLIPRLNVEQETFVLPGPTGYYLLQVFARLENVGEIPLKVREWRIWICPLDPLPPTIADTLQKRSACVDKELPLEYCAGGKIKEDCFDEIRMRTGEIQEIIASVLVPQGNKIVRVHSFFPHPALNERPGEDRGWTRYNIVNLEEQHVERTKEHV
jgi:hypothetical protein